MQLHLTRHLPQAPPLLRARNTKIGICSESVKYLQWFLPNVTLHVIKHLLSHYEYHSATISRRGGGGVVCCASIVNHCEMGSNPEPLALSFVHNLVKDRGACAQKGAAKKKELKVLEGTTHTSNILALIPIHCDKM